LPQPGDVTIDGSGGRKASEVPNLIQKLLPGDHLIGVFREELEDLTRFFPVPDPGGDRDLRDQSLRKN
jgi:hypothetical protein